MRKIKKKESVNEMHVTKEEKNEFAMAFEFQRMSIAEKQATMYHKIMTTSGICCCILHAFYDCTKDGFQCQRNIEHSCSFLTDCMYSSYSGDVIQKFIKIAVYGKGGNGSLSHYDEFCPCVYGEAAPKSLQSLLQIYLSKHSVKQFLAKHLSYTIQNQIALMATLQKKTCEYQYSKLIEKSKCRIITSGLTSFQSASISQDVIHMIDTYCWTQADEQLLWIQLMNDCYIFEIGSWQIE